jgi:hypothetical protein
MGANPPTATVLTLGELATGLLLSLPETLEQGWSTEGDGWVNWSGLAAMQDEVIQRSVRRVEPGLAREPERGLLAGVPKLARCP